VVFLLRLVLNHLELAQQLPLVEHLFLCKGKHLVLEFDVHKHNALDLAVEGGRDGGDVVDLLAQVEEFPDVLRHVEESLLYFQLHLLQLLDIKLDDELDQID